MFIIIKTSQPLEELMLYADKVSTRKYTDKKDMKQLSDYWDSWSGVELE
ncbi:MAG: hypothetical protein QXR60_02490 [Candidatus Nanoarchaeia archaeon]